MALKTHRGDKATTHGSIYKTGIQRIQWNPLRNLVVFVTITMYIMQYTRLKSTRAPADQRVLCVTGRQCGGGAGVQRTTEVAWRAMTSRGAPGAWDHGERRSGAGLSGARSSSTPTGAPTEAAVSMAVGSDVITLDWKKRSGEKQVKRYQIVMFLCDCDDFERH